VTNDADGQFNPPVAIALPSATEQSLLFKFAATAASTNNANDYALSTGPATFTNDHNETGTVHALAGVGGGPSGGSLALSIPSPNPVRSSMAYSVILPREANVRVRILDLGGRVMRSLVNRTLAAGTHNFAWNAADAAHGARSLSNGMYFLELNAGGARRSQRFVILQ
jgi:hypothetical protein